MEIDPDADALVSGDRTVSYSELDRLSSRIARVLIGQGLGPEDIVAIAITRSVESVVALWSIAKTGAAFLPVDPTYPADRVQHMLSDSGALVGVTTAAYRAGLPDPTRWIVLDDPIFEATLATVADDKIAVSDRISPLRADNTAYLIYTSGSTGVPKGVVVTHSGLADLAAEQMDRYGLTHTARTLHFASPSFDASILELLLAIAAGSTMVIAPTDIYGGDELGSFLHDQKVTHAFITPAALASVDQSGKDSLQAVIVGGESVPPELVDRWANDRQFFDVYGPTETTVVSTISSPITPGDAMSIGDAITGTVAYVLDRRLRPVPTGVAGELYLGGAGVTRGYHGKFALTASRYVPNPFVDNGTRVYRTGDVVRRNSAGSLEYVARNDSQVKVRGFRIELGEVDTALMAHPEVAFAVTVGHDGPAGDTILVSYVRRSEGADPDPEELISFVGKSLPKHMIPSSIMVIDEIPLTPSGKLDRDRLPDPVFATRKFRAPETDTEIAVAAVFAEILGIDRIGVDDDFFELGGNSLSATRLAARIGASLDVKVGAREVFADSTVRGLAAVAVGLESGTRVALTVRERPHRIPLSYAQQRMWFLNRFDDESLAYNVPIAIRLTGDLDRAALGSAIADLVVKHDVLRTVYPEHEGTGFQQILAASDMPTALDIRTVSENDLIARVSEFAAHGFDVTSEVPFRTALFEISAGDAVLVLVAHHIAVDGFSIGPLTRDVMQAYVARASGAQHGLPPLDIQYADFALWQREALGAEDDAESILAQQVSYWSKQLDGLPELLELPTDRPRPAVATDAGAAHTFVVDAELASAVSALARSRDATLFMVTSAALAIVLAKTSGTSDIAIGTAVAGRGEEALDDLVGMFVNTLVLRNHVDDSAAVADVIDSAREAALEAFAHADVPFERLVEILDPPRSTAHTPLFQVMLTLQNLDSAVLELPGLRIGAVDYDSTSAKFDLAVTLTPSGADGAIGGTIVYATDLFDEASVESLANRFVAVLRSATLDPARRVRSLDLRSAAEKSNLVRWNDTDVERTEDTVLDAFDRIVRATPDAPAVTVGDRTLTYAEFDRRVETAARRLAEVGVAPDTSVAVIAARSLDMLTGIYAVLRAGGAYVPVDPTWPAERIDYVLKIAQPVVVLTAGEDPRAADARVDAAAHAIPVIRLDALGGEPDDASSAPRPVLRPDNLAYTIFTSGSTGRPKGVSVSHRAIVGQLDWLASEFSVGPGDAVLQKTAAGFDASVWELLMPLRAGARVVLADPDGHRDPRYMADLVAAESITIAQFVPSVLALMSEVADRGELRSLRAVLVGGEQLDAALASEIRDVSGADVHNVYGPTETTVQVTHAASGPSDLSVVPIGTPVSGATLHVLDGGLNEVPVSVVGELYVGGDQLARGYNSRSALTAERFVANPFGDNGSRLYRTGDLVRRRSDGSLVYVGRSDAQVKLNGLRIELGEIESALRSDASVSAAAASIVGGTLVGYVVPAEGRTFDETSVRESLGSILPEYMIPGRFMVLGELPSNSSGKLDRRALPAPSLVAAQSYRAPVTETEELLATLFAEVLGVERIGLDDSFFAMGGDSIMSIQLVSRAKARGVLFRPRDVFDAKTVGRLAEVASRSSAEDAVVLAELDGGGIGTMPTTPIVEAMIERGAEYGRFTQSMALELPVGIDRAGIVATIGAVVDHHDMLRASLDADTHAISVAPVGSVDVNALVYQVECDSDATNSAVAEAGSRAVDHVLGELDPSSGTVVRFVWLDFGPARAGRILVVAHHLVVDGVSWRILVPDFVTAWAQLKSGSPVALAPVGTSMRTWAHALRDEAGSQSRLAELEYWSRVVRTPDPLLGSRAFDPSRDTRSTMKSVAVSVCPEVTDVLLTKAPTVIRGGVNDVLLTALAMAVTELRRRHGTDAPTTLVHLEGHGREEDVVPGADLSRTVGWFTTVFPVALDLSGIDMLDAFGSGGDVGSALKSVKETLAAVPDKGIGFGLLRYLGSEAAESLDGPGPQVGFNYLGRVGAGAGEIPAGIEIGWVPAGDMGEIDAPADDLAAVALVDVNALVVNTAEGEQLEASFAYASDTVAREDTEELSRLWVHALESIATYAASEGAGGLTPSDVPLVSVTQDDIVGWEARYGDVEDIWPLTPLQQGLQFHALAADEHPDVYMPQIVLTLGGDLDAPRLRAAAEAAVARHASVRTVFRQAANGESVQLVRARSDVGWHELDLTGLAEADKQTRLQAAIADDRLTRFDLAFGPMLRFTVVRLLDNDFRLIVTDHHIVLDGWSMPILLQEILALYALRADDRLLPRPRSYRSYLAWLAGRDTAESVEVWATALPAGGDPTLVAGVERVTVSEWAEIDTLTVGSDSTRALTDTAAHLQVTMNTLVQAAWGVLLARTLGRTDVVFGATVSGRPVEIDGVENMVGLFINTVPVRVRLESEDTVATFLQRLQSEQVELLEHHHVGLSDIKRRVGAGAEFDTLTVFESYPVDASGIAEQAASIDGLTVQGMSFAESTHYPITFRITAGEQLNIRLEYMSDVVTPEVARELLRSLDVVLNGFASDTDAPLGSLVEALQPLAVRAWPPRPESGAEARIGVDVAGAVAAVESVLGLTGVRPEDNVFELGAASLDAVALSTVVSTALGRRVSVSDVLTAESIAALVR